MKKIVHYYSLAPEWQNEFVQNLGGQLIDNKIIVIPEDAGVGASFFSQVMPGISVFYIDVTLNKPLKITRKVSDHELYIFHYDLSEHVNLIKINERDYEVGSFDKLDLAIIDNQIESTYKPAVNERTVALRILVDKALLKDFIAKYSNINHIEPNVKGSKKVFYHYGNIDSNSVILMQSIKNKSIYDLSFEPLLQGVSLRLLGNFLGKFYGTHVSSVVNKSEQEAINNTKEYLLNNLYGSFPSVLFLASMVGMSVTKYKKLFKKYFNNTPNNYFIKEKFLLAQKLLQSGEYYSITDVVYALNYFNLSHFSSKYYKMFNKKTIDDFVRNEIKNID